MMYEDTFKCRHMAQHQNLGLYIMYIKIISSLYMYTCKLYIVY